ncbi:hypothetical protein DICPUDRAFT_54285 [Dictyostelium purpureum]|uniref:Coiled-coil domain-containing protein 47 n=1 Tax=Dictyostelium purpureum TaxID=5786 RepID=F0ZGC1_DICPU|nr:uncharacterized protein DICPUDRAFT_54285 [Dictyostelium purpureum]EGC37038.1 hypothetical protein DICPUDRAFT_54285 [Dictyostelium purpureum]|eukprot:XP_003286466.1 hypothetical protein DICPUDRAFT_54285 [Dictyostelium purpureum]
MVKFNKFIILVLLVLICSFVSKSFSQENDSEEFEQNEINIDGGSEAPQDTSMETEQVKVIRKPNNYLLEIVFISIIIAYAVNYFVGQNTNRELIKLWGKKLQPVFDSNFAKTGNKGTFTILKVNASTYSFLCTGRINCFGLQATLDLKKRHDLFSVIMDLVGYGNPDRMTIEIAINKENMDPLVFALVKSKAIKKFKSDNNDVDLFCSKYTGSGISGLASSFGVLCDTEVLPSLLLKSEALQVINQNENLVECMHFSDHSLINPKYPKALRFVFKFPKQSEMDKLALLTKMAIHYIDVVANLELPKNYKAKADKLRDKAKEEIEKQAKLERQEELQKKKYEKKLKEKEAISKLTPEQQRKRDEKEYKQQLKKRTGAGGKTKIVLG